MLDREKVIKGLHCCSHTDGANCIYCPYDISDTDCTALMAMDVLDLLKEQEIVRCDKCSMRDRTKMCHIWGKDVKDDDYCSYGKWKKGELDDRD